MPVSTVAQEGKLKNDCPSLSILPAFSFQIGRTPAAGMMPSMIAVTVFVWAIICAPSTWAFEADAVPNREQPVVAGFKTAQDNNRPRPENLSVGPILDKPAAGALRAMSRREKFSYYLRSTCGWDGVAWSVAAAGFSQALDSVPEWGQGMQGYGKRLGSRSAQRAIKNSIEAGAGVLLNENPRYTPSRRSGIWKRGLYASSRTFLSQPDSGGIRPGYSKLIAIVGATYISRQWWPKAYRTASEYAWGSAVGLGMEAGKNIFAEFWPDIRRWLRR